METVNRYWACIDLDALRANMKWLRQKSGKKLICVVKADAYGHGDYRVVKELSANGVEYFAVSNTSEALGLREKGILSRLLIFGTTPKDSFHLLRDENLTQTIYSTEYAEELSAWAISVGCKINVHIKLDTGMGRMGFRSCGDVDATDELLHILELPGLNCEGIYTHFSCADTSNPEDIAYTKGQYAAFEKQVKRLQEKGAEFEWIHCQNSGGILYYEAPICNACRPGIVLYGISPREEDLCPPSPLQPVMSLYATVTDVRNLPIGAYISYGRHYLTDQETRLAVVPAGYADGYIRALKGGSVLVGGKKAPIVGNICMDQFMVNVTAFPEVKPGDEIVLLGKQGNAVITAEELANLAGTIPYELTCAVSRRVPRRYEKAGREEEEICYL